MDPSSTMVPVAWVSSEEAEFMSDELVAPTRTVEVAYFPSFINFAILPTPTKEIL